MPDDIKRATEIDLFTPARMGALDLRNCIVMAPLTRSRAAGGDVPTKLNADYYAERASAGLIISEATNISQQGKGYAFTPGIYTDEQVAGWRLVTDAVHAEGGTMLCQLWHVGRMSHPTLQPGGGLPVAPSAVKPEGKAFTEDVSSRWSLRGRGRLRRPRRHRPVPSCHGVREAGWLRWRRDPRLQRLPARPVHAR